MEHTDLENKVKVIPKFDHAAAEEAIKNNGRIHYLKTIMEGEGFYHSVSTIGFTGQNKPELIIVGNIPTDILDLILNRVADAVYSRVEKLEDGLCVSITPLNPSEVNDYGSSVLTYKLVHVVGHFPEEMQGAQSFYGERVLLDYYQILWADENGNYPTHSDFNPVYNQPILAKPVH